MSAILILAEAEHGTLSHVTARLVTAAKALPGTIDILVTGHAEAQNIAEQASKLEGVARVLFASDPALEHGLAEYLAPLLRDLASNGNYSHILAPATTFGKDVLPRAAALCNAQQISDITAILAPNRFVRPIYAGNVFATVSTSAEHDPLFITVRPSVFSPAAAGGAASIEPTNYAAPQQARVTFVGKEESDSSRPELTAARVVISGGRGLGSAENFALIETLADKLGAAIGASRAAVDAGYISNDHQVGQTGKNVAPELYIAVGISGAIQHLAGMKESKVIVAINQDENAPIFDVADYGLVADLFTAVPELEAAL